MAIPQLLLPSANGNPLLVHGNALLQLSDTIVGLGQVEHVASILRFVNQTLLQKTNISLKFIRLASTVVAVVDITHGERKTLCRPIPVLVGHSAARPRMLHVNNTSIRILECAGLLNHSIARPFQRVGLQVSANEHHVRIKQQTECIRQVPSGLLQVGLCVPKAHCAVVSKVLPRLVRETSVVRLEELGGNCTGLIRRPRVADTKCRDKISHGL